VRPKSAVQEKGAIMRIFSLLSLAIVLLLSLVASAQRSADAKSMSSPTSADTDFMKKAAQGGMAEVALGELAIKNGSNPDVKKFAQRMVNDHTKANDQLKQLAQQKGVELPQGLTAKDKGTKEELSRFSGAKFDRQYMEDMVTDHKKDVADFQRESMSAQDPDLKNFAVQTLPTLQEHLKQAESIAPTVSASR
jgi:putative membrane protein